MNYSGLYDLLIAKSVGREHVLEDYPYYDNIYCTELKREIIENGLWGAFGKLEFRNQKKDRIKICAVASSSRIGFFYGMQKGIVGFEKTDIRNGVCKPHYDNYDSINNIYYEYKCHEFTSDRDKRHNRIVRNTEGYCKLIQKHFPKQEKINLDDLYKTFGITPCMYFDFKQLICHILGLISIATISSPVSLQYIMFVPDVSILKLEENIEIADWLRYLEDSVNHIFDSLSDIPTVNCAGEQGKLNDFIKLCFEYQDVSLIKDFVYEKIK